MNKAYNGIESAGACARAGARARGGQHGWGSYDHFLDWAVWIAIMANWVLPLTLQFLCETGLYPTLTF